jgi:hypothetical protein
MAKSVRFEDVDETNVDELLESHSSELANEDLNNMNDDSLEPFLTECIKELSTKQITDFLNTLPVPSELEKMILRRLEAPKLREIWLATKNFIVRGTMLPVS